MPKSKKTKRSRPKKHAAAKRATKARVARKHHPSQLPGATRKTAPDAHAALKPDFNHAMLYSRDLERSARFYVDALGFEPIDDYRHEGRLLYLRLRAPIGNGTLALHLVAPGKVAAPENEGVRLYFEVEKLETFCRKLAAKRVILDKLPKMMPWGWMHAYLTDPDGHEISLYRAGAGRFLRTMQKSATSGRSAVART
jgi:catechol 2,3-dioxygenase-like lactoylglutathione lyase family enzyme